MSRFLQVLIGLQQIQQLGFHFAVLLRPSLARGMEEERRVVCTVTRLFTSKVGGMEEGEKGEEDTGP